MLANQVLAPFQTDSNPYHSPYLRRPVLINSTRTALVEELDDPDFATRQHYSKATYSAGCRGSFCTLAASHWYRYRRHTAGLPAEDVDFEGNVSMADFGLTLFTANLLVSQYRQLPPHLLWQMERLEIVTPVMPLTRGELAWKLAEVVSDEYGKTYGPRD